MCVMVKPHEQATILQSEWSSSESLGGKKKKKSDVGSDPEVCNQSNCSLHVGMNGDVSQHCDVLKKLEVKWIK